VTATAIVIPVKRASAIAGALHLPWL